MSRLWSEVGGIVFFAGLLTYALVDGGRQETVVCERATGKPRCAVEERGLVSSRTEVFESLSKVRVISHRRRGGSYYGIGLTDSTGLEIEVATSIDKADADQVEQWFAKRGPAVEVVRERFSTKLKLLLLFSLMMMASLTWSVVRRVRALRAES